MPALIYLGAEHELKTECLDPQMARYPISIKEIRARSSFSGRKTIRNDGAISCPGQGKALLTWRNHLLHARKRRRMDVISDRVFCHLDGSPIKGFQSAWEATKEKAKIKDFHFP